MPGELDPDEFWQPALGARFGWQPWDLGRVRVAHYDAALRYVKEVPSFG